jgi:hypothetical protein
MGLFCEANRTDEWISLPLHDQTDELRRWYGAFEAHQIDYAVLKGCAGLLNQSFSFKTRQVSDIDILIDPSKQKEVYKLLQTNGFQMSTSIYPTKWHQKHPTDHAPMHAHKNGAQLNS